MLIHITFGTTEDAKRKRENGEAISIDKAQGTICPYMNFPEGTILTRFTAGVIIIREVLR